MRRAGDLDPLGMALTVEAEAHVLINKADKPLHPTQDGLNLHLIAALPLFDPFVAA
jgi:hypothetical protein